MHITDLWVEDIPPFMEKAEWDFDEHVNLFIGPNGTGKSTILKILDREYPSSGIPGWDADHYGIRMSADWPSGTNRRPNPRAVPRVYIPPVREPMPVSLSHTKVALSSFLQNLHAWDDILSPFPFNRFQSERVYHAMKKLAEEDLQRRNSTRSADVADIAFRCTEAICTEFFRGSAAKHYLATEKLGESASALSDMPVVHYGMAIDLPDVGSIYVGDLSSGTQGTYLWVWYLALRIANFYRFADDWHKKPAILCIDEVENHLHPIWQRRVLPSLSTVFEGLQIFATTHSPFVVAGLKRGQIHRLYKDEGIVKTQKITDEEKSQEILGWSVEEILREFMGVDDPTDAITANAAATLRWLRYQPTSDEPAEEWKQAQIEMLQNVEFPSRDEMAALMWLKGHTALRGEATQWRNEKVDELRSVVRRDFESGGPIAAQRELFLEQLDELLQEHDRADDDVEEERS